jgi:hypothetical protein
MTGTSPDSSPTPLRAATQGFAELAGWFTALAGKHAVEVAREIDEDRFDATSALARAATLPVIGLAAFLNEVLDAASVITHPPQVSREATSDDFVGLDQWTATHTLQAHDLLNGFDEPLPGCVKLSVESRTLGEHLIFRLTATNIPHECVGVYRGTVSPVGERDGVAAWLMIP